jgi:hypothetical protein
MANQRSLLLSAPSAPLPRNYACVRLSDLFISGRGVRSDGVGAEDLDRRRWTGAASLVLGQERRKAEGWLSNLDIRGSIEGAEIR